MSNKHNYYSEQLDGGLFDSMPKTVLAAIAVSSLTLGGEYLDTAKNRVAAEWLALYQNGIVTQKPTATAMKLAEQSDQ